MRKSYLLVYSLLVLGLFAGCDKGDDGGAPSGTVSASACSAISLTIPDHFAGAGNPSWKVVSAPSDFYRLSGAATASPVFIALDGGKYTLQVTAGGQTDEIVVNIKEPSKQFSQYISKVFDYMPAPGQFVNELPKYAEGDTHAQMVAKAEKAIAGEKTSMITLGGWGGYVVFGFDHTVVNVAGRRDFRIKGNAFGAAANHRPNAPFGGSCEPGIIMVAYDRNGNGVPDDDEWYEIRGSSNFSAESEPWYAIAVGNGNDVNVYRDYEMTYHKPVAEDPQQVGEEDNPEAFVTIPKYIRWEDNKAGGGYKVKNIYHSQSYYPAWVKDAKLTFKGIRLPENGINEGQYNPGVNGASVYFVLYGFRYGYVDNQPNTDNNSAIDIDWAIDKNGNKVDLPGIDFVKVYGGVNQENGWLGECSTEIMQGEDLHVRGILIETINE